MKRCHLFISIVCLTLSLSAQPMWNRVAQPSITIAGSTVTIAAGCLHRTIDLSEGKREETHLLVGNKQVATSLSPTFTFSVSRAVPNIEPKGVPIGTAEAVEQKNSVANNSDALKVKESKVALVQNVDFPPDHAYSAAQTEKLFGKVEARNVVGTDNGWRIDLVRAIEKHEDLAGLTVIERYEVYHGYEAIRKSLIVENHSNRWIRISDFMSESLTPQPDFSHTQPLTPEDKGVLSAITGYGNSDFSRGVIAVSEAPSAIRYTDKQMKMGYRSEFFEWVLGPGERFEADPTLLYGYQGETFATVSARSTAMDRCVENDYARFMRTVVVRPSLAIADLVPLFCTWTNYNSDIRTDNMSHAAKQAAEMGFQCFQLDAGWSDTNGRNDWAVVTVNFDRNRFPNHQTFLHRLSTTGMKLGQWYSVFRSPQLLDMSSSQAGFSYPLVKRGGGVGMSFASEWKRTYADELIHLHKSYGTRYVKQDLTNSYYGDIAEGHESRSRKESLLRSIRGMFYSQELAHRSAPDMILQLSHEIYWRTPGPPADVAVLKYADVYHATPNEYWGAADRKRTVAAMNRSSYSPDSLRRQLLRGALRARENWYSHRGLPLYKIEIFGAATTNVNGSMTPQVADRQICSWLMGAPTSFSGDLDSLTPELRSLYNDRFTKIKAMQKRYGIYYHFQYSGVPAPTDTDWHWWGKLNDRKEGVVVVLRGAGGAASVSVNIPWVDPAKRYEVKGLLSNKSYQRFKGTDLINGKLNLSLPEMGQEILELSLVAE